ncbi:MAG: M1 family metallopeptidase [Ignavibacteria bacterium]|nr:M1 family metallopeptidase [Ignavibacteria bacterium]
MNYDNRIYKKGTLIYFSAFFINIVLSVFFIMASGFVSKEALRNFEEVSEESKGKGFYLIEKLSGLFGDDAAGDVRVDTPEALAHFELYDALNYDIELSFDLNQRLLNGVVYARLQPNTDTLRTIYLNLYDNMKVSELKMGNLIRTGIDYTRNFRSMPMEDVTYSQANNYLTVRLSESQVPMKGDIIVLKIVYSGKPLKKGFDSFSFKEIYGNLYIYTLSEPNWGPVWWPSKDFPDDKALVNMSLRVPTGWWGISNGVLKDTLNNGDGTTTFNWESNYPIATYLVSIVCGKMNYWSDTYTSLDGKKQMPIMYFAFPKNFNNAKFDWERTPEMIKLYSELFGEYPFINEKYGMAEFGWTSGAMEHQTISSMGYLLQTGDKRYENVVAHELAHHWWGNAVTLKDWKNIWLNEGFATYSEALWEEYQKGRKAYLDYMKGKDFGYFSGTIYAPKGFIDNFAVYATVYQKGSWVLHMLRGVMGDEKFFGAIRAYYERHKYKNAETSQLVEICEEFYGSKLDWFFDQWVYKGTGRPRYEYSWKKEEFQDQKGSGNYTVRVRIKQVQKDDDFPVYKMPLKISVSTKFGEQEFTVFNDQRDQTFQFVTDSEPTDVYLDKEGWILKKAAKGSYEEQ